MDTSYKNARITMYYNRALFIKLIKRIREQGMSVKDAAAQQGISPRTA
jgi:hypothetical protein